jgi:RNA polymerase sigma-70 factor (ECF subfamily)
LPDKKKENLPLEAVAGVEVTGGAPERPAQQVNLRNFAGLRAQLARVTGSPELAADLLQDAIVTALQKLRAGEISDPSHLDGYVYRVAINHLRNHRRKDKSRAANSEGISDLVDADSERQIASLEVDEWARLAKKLLQEVTPRRDRDLLIRFYLREESKEDLCRAFGLSELHFNRVIYRARDRFRELLQRRGLGKSDFLSVTVVVILSQLLSAHGIHPI